MRVAACAAVPDVPAAPDVPVTVTVYVPAGVPPVAGGADELPPHATWNITPPNSMPSSVTGSQAFRGDRLPTPTPISAIPVSGRNTAYQSIDPPWRTAVVTGRAVVVIVRVDVSGLVLLEALNASGFVENAHAAPAGNPAEQESETLFGKLGIGVAVT